MTKQHNISNPKTIGKENAYHFEEEKKDATHQKLDEMKTQEIDSKVKQSVEDGRGLDEKIPRNAFLKLDLDAIALRMKKDLADRCCCADVPCVSIVKEYCESRYDFCTHYSSYIYIYFTTATISLLSTVLFLSSKVLSMDFGTSQKMEGTGLSEFSGFSYAALGFILLFILSILFGVNGVHR